MRRIALLEIVVDDRYYSSGYCPGDADGLPHKIVLSSNDIETFRRIGMPEHEINSALPSTLAHELGHFIAAITGVSSHKNIMDATTSVPDPPHAIMQRERDAWALAEKMIPIQQNTKAACLKSYSDLHETKYQLPSMVIGEWTVSEK